MTQYENQLAALRLEVKRLRNYDCYAKEVQYQELQTEVWNAGIFSIPRRLFQKIRSRISSMLLCYQNPVWYSTQIP